MFSSRSLYYDGERELLKFVTRPTSVHEAPSSWLNWWVNDLGLGHNVATRAELLGRLISNSPRK